MTEHRRALVRADGGSRGNPGHAGYGAVLEDADTGEILGEAAEYLGKVTNNVAEYRGLIAGLQMYAERTPDAELEVRMDSKLVIEQMAGRWKVKHPDMRPLAIEAQRLAPFGTVWTWVPRAENGHADRLANLAMDAGERGGQPDLSAAAASGSGTTGKRSTRGRGESRAAPRENPAADALVGWASLSEASTRIVMLRHGVSELTQQHRFSGAAGADPGLTPLGREQAERAAAVLKARGDIDALVVSPLRRATETADAVSAVSGLDPVVDAGYSECAFGAWDGLTLDEVRDRWPRELAEWRAGLDNARPPGGESLAEARERVEGALTATLTEHRGETVVVVSHVTPIKLMLRVCLHSSWDVTHHMLLAPGSLSTLWFFESGASVVREWSVVP